MIAAHYGAALAAASLERRPRLGAMILAAQWLDLYPAMISAAGYSPIAAAAAVRHPQACEPVLRATEGFPAAVFWACVAWCLSAASDDSPRLGRKFLAASLIAATVLSHPALDRILPDEPLPLGRALLVFAADFLLFSLGAWLYARSRRSVKDPPSMRFAVLCAFLASATVVTAVLNLGEFRLSAAAAGETAFLAFTALTVAGAAWVQHPAGASDER